MFCDFCHPLFEEMSFEKLIPIFEQIIKKSKLLALKISNNEKFIYLLTNKLEQTV